METRPYYEKGINKRNILTCSYYEIKHMILHKICLEESKKARKLKLDAIKYKIMEWRDDELAEAESFNDDQTVMKLGKRFSTLIDMIDTDGDMKSAVSEGYVTADNLNFGTASKKRMDANGLTVKQQIIFMEYIGAFDNTEISENSSKRAELLGICFSRHKDSFRQAYTRFHTGVLTAPNLIVVIKLFRKYGLDYAIESIKKDPRISKEVKNELKL